MPSSREILATPLLRITLSNSVNWTKTTVEVVEQLRTSEGCPDASDELPKAEGICSRLWLLFEFPESSRAAFVVGIISVIMTLVSIVLFCVETLPVFAMSHCEHDEAPNFADPFFVIETVCTAWFTLEIFVRLAGCPSKLDFCKDVKNLVDIGAILPYYVTLINVLSTMSCEGAKSSASLAFLRVTRLVHEQSHIGRYRRSTEAPSFEITNVARWQKGRPGQDHDDWNIKVSIENKKTKLSIKKEQ